MGISELTYQLTGYTILRRLEFDVAMSDGQCTLRLELAKDVGDAEAVRAEFTGVADLSLKHFGGGLTQLLYLAVEDISEQQHDRIHFRVRDLERDMIAFLCDGLVIQPLGR